MSTEQTHAAEDGTVTETHGVDNSLTTSHVEVQSDVPKEENTTFDAPAVKEEPVAPAEVPEIQADIPEATNVAVDSGVKISEVAISSVGEIPEESIKIEDEPAAPSSVPSENGITANDSVLSDNDLTADSSVESDRGGPVAPKKPLLALTAPPVTGHTSPLLRLAGDMTSRGFEVIFMSTQQFKGAIEKTGAEFYESTTPFADIEYLKSRSKLPPGLPTLMADMENMFIKQMAPRSAEFKALLEMVRERDPHRDVVVITETMSLAPLPFLFGAPLPKGYDTFPKTININTVPIMLLSIDTGITGPCLPPDASESGRARNKLMNEMLVRGPLGNTDKVFHDALKQVGCTSLPKVFFQNAWLDSYDTTFQLCVPSLEYPRSDLHLSIRFSGALPKRDIDPKFQFPSWWSEIKSNAALPVGERKKIVAVAQGTVALDYSDLILPTIKGLAKRSDVIVVSILGVKGATLPTSEDFSIPENARVIDHLPYDALLEYADIFVQNGGYGGLSHGVLNGVPMILAGTSEDKAEVCARGAYAGFAINLRVQRPTPEQILNAAETIFTDPSYKHRAMRLMQENEDLDCVSIFERQINKYSKTV